MGNRVPRMCQEDTGEILTFQDSFINGQLAQAVFDAGDQTEGPGEPETSVNQPHFLKNHHIEPPKVANATKAGNHTLTKGGTFCSIKPINTARPYLSY